MKRLSHATLVFVLALFLLPSFSSFPKEKPALGVSGQEAAAYVKVLTSDDFQGRRSGLPGGLKASQWIADQFKKWGLEPAGSNGYFQDFKKPVFQVEEAALAIDNGKKKRTFAYDDEWRIQQYSGSAAVRGELVFAGYGIVSDKDKWNEYEGLSLKDKVVLMIGYGAPSFLAAKIGIEGMPEAKIETASKLGAKAIIFVDPPGDIFQSMRYSFPSFVMIPKEKYKPDMVLAGANENVTKFIFRESGIDLRTRVQRLEREQKPASAALGVTVELAAKTTNIPEGPMRNVLAKIQGTDKALKNQYVIVGAHLDHLGYSPEGEVYPGADDNASGTAVIMEVARVMKVNKIKPRRTIIFALWDGEEQGLFGSLYYCDNPIYPLDKTIVNLNLDMVGHGDGKLSFRGIYYGPEIWDILKASLPQDVVKDIVTSRGGPGGSDHTPFLAKGVPGFFLQTAGDHYGRHNVGDKFDLIDPVLLEKAAVFTQDSLSILADKQGFVIPPYREELDILKSSTIVGLKPWDMSELVEKAAAVDFFDLDFALVSVPGDSPLALARGLVELAGKVKSAKNIVLYQPPSPNQMPMRTGGDKITIFPGLTDLSRLGGELSLLKLMAKSGLGYVMVKDGDIKDTPEFKELVRDCNEEGVLLIFKTSDPLKIKSILGLGTRPSLLIAEKLEGDILNSLKEKRWRVALGWPQGLPIEDFQKRLEGVRQAMAPDLVLSL